MDSERRMQTSNLFQLITIASKSSHVSDKVGNANRHIGNVRLEKKDTIIHLIVFTLN